MAVRRPAFGDSVKYWLKPDLENRVKEGSIKALFDTVVTSISSSSVALERQGQRIEISNDFVLALTGYHPDFPFLRSIGIEVTADGHLVHDAQTMESGIPGLYLAGVVAAGVSIGKLFIENGRNHAVQIVQHILHRSGESPRTPLAQTPLRRFQDGD